MTSSVGYRLISNRRETETSVLVALGFRFFPVIFVQSVLFSAAYLVATLEDSALALRARLGHRG